MSSSSQFLDKLKLFFEKVLNTYNNVSFIYTATVDKKDLDIEKKSNLKSVINSLYTIKFTFILFFYISESDNFF